MDSFTGTISLVEFLYGVYPCRQFRILGGFVDLSSETFVSGMFVQHTGGKYYNV